MSNKSPNKYIGLDAAVWWISDNVKLPKGRNAEENFYIVVRKLEKFLISGGVPSLRGIPYRAGDLNRYGNLLNIESSPEPITCLDSDMVFDIALSNIYKNHNILYHRVELLQSDLESNFIVNPRVRRAKAGADAKAQDGDYNWEFQKKFVYRSWRYIKYKFPDCNDYKISKIIADKIHTLKFRMRCYARQERPIMIYRPGCDKDSKDCPNPNLDAIYRLILSFKNLSKTFTAKDLGIEEE